MSAPAFLEPDVVLFLHDQSIREFGGYHGVRDEAVQAEGGEGVGGGEGH